MDIKTILKKADSLFAENKAALACEYLEMRLVEAKQEKDWRTELSILNELMGYYRSISRFDKAWEYALAAMETAQAHQVTATADGATTYLNVATVYRACGKFNEALILYTKVEEVYLREGLQKDYRLGGLYNNMCVACIEAGKGKDAADYGSKAIEILQDIADAAEECAVVCCNLAGIQLQSKEKDLQRAEAYLNRSLALFADKCPDSPHYGGAVAMKAYICYLKGDAEQSVALYTQAIETTKAHFGENLDFKGLVNNCIAICEKSGMAAKAQELRVKYQKG